MRTLYFLTFFIIFLYPIFSQNSLVQYTIKNINANSKYSDFGTSFFGPNRVYFASNVENAKSNFKYENLFETYEAPNFDLYKAIVQSTGELDYVEKISIASSIKYNKSNASFAPDMKHVYFTQNNVIDGKKAVSDKYGNVNMKIFRADVDSDGQWSNFVSMPFNSDQYSCTHPSVSEDNKLLFFASNMPGTLGMSDIYWVTINEDGTYGIPRNMGPLVNSRKKENFPYVDKNILYFSSNRLSSLGGLDVYMVRLDDPGSIPMNLGEPINSKQDDFCFTIERQNKKGYFSSNRPGGKGSDDIYYFTQDTDFKECKQTITGKVLDSHTKSPLSNAIVSLYTQENILLYSFPVNNDGSYSFELTCRDNYRIESSHLEYNSTFREIFFPQDVSNQNVILYLNPKIKIVEVKPKPKEEKVIPKAIPKVVPNEKIIPSVIKNKKEILDLPPVYFELDSYYITKEAEVIIRRAINILNEYPDISIEFASHTDARASDSYNLHLSDLRANEVMKFMLKQGISNEKIVGRGYGESQPVNHCVDGVKCSEEEHLQNRRAEFIIIKK